MRNFLFYKLLNGKKLLFLSILFTFSVISYYNIRMGPVGITSNDSVYYIRWADNLIDLKFNLLNFYIQNPFMNSTYFYTIPVLFMALAKFFFGGEWHNIFLLFNLSLVFFSIILFSKSLLILGIRPLIIALCIPLLIISPDWMTWPGWILTDTIYAFLIMLVTFIIIKGISENKFRLITIILIMILIILTRPTFFPVIFSIIFYMIIFDYNFYNRPKLLLPFLLLFFLIVPIFDATLHYLIKIYYSASSSLNIILDWVDQGIVIWDRDETHIDPPANFIDYIYLYFLRLLNFFNPYANTFSKFHVIVNYFQFFYITMSVIIWSFLGGNNRLFDKTVTFILLLSLSVSAFHSFLLLDWDWRYRFPIIMPLMMILPISIEIILKKFKSNINL